MMHRVFNKVRKIWRHSILGRTKKVENPVRWGIIGLGYMAETFSCAIDGNKEGIVYAVASRSLDKAKSFASRHGRCKAYGSYADMVNDKELCLDIVYIATPVKYHYEHIKLCLNAGLNVICEKPITSNIAQLEELIEIAKRNNCFFMEGMWMKCLPTFQQACSWINAGCIGDVELVKVDFYKREHIRKDYTIYNASEGGGVLRDFGVYAIAFIEHFLGGYPDKMSYLNHISSYEIDSDWQISAELNNTKAVVNLSSNFASLSKALIVGKKGCIEWDSQFNRTNSVTLFSADGIVVEKYHASYKFEGFEYEVNEVQKCLRNEMKESELVPLKETYNTMLIIDNLSKNL